MAEAFNNIIVRGISAAVPSDIEENISAKEVLGERRCKKQIKLTGIERRHISIDGQVFSDLCYPPARDLMKHLGWHPEEIRVLVLVTQSQNYRAPSTAYLLHKLLKLSKDCVVFDVNLGCSAFNVGLQIVGSLLQQFPDGAKGLCIQGDLGGYCMQPGRSADMVAGQMLFGSGASATAIEKKKGAPYLPFMTKSDGNRYRMIYAPVGATASEIDGEGIFTFAINDVVYDINAFKKDCALKEKDIDYYVFHQAQKLILDNVADACGVENGRELRSLVDYGNTSGASVPLSLCVNRDIFANKKIIRVLTCGFGVGLSWSMAYIELETKNILPLIVTDMHFER